MLFKALTTYRIPADRAEWHPSDDGLRSHGFAPTTPSNPVTFGWAEIQPGQMAMSVAGHTMLKLIREARAVPASVLKRETDKICATMEEDTGHKPGRMERKTIEEDQRLKLLHQAFGVQQVAYVWIDHENHLCHINTTTGALLDAVGTKLAFSGGGIIPLQTKVTPDTAMSAWVSTGEAPYGFTIDRDCRIKGTEGQALTIKNMALDDATVAAAAHVKAGKVVTKLAMTYTSESGTLVHFSLTDSGALTGMSLEDIKEDRGDEASDEADFALMIGLFGAARAAVTEALGGIVENQATAS